MHDSPGRLLTFIEAGHRLGVSHDTVNRHVKNGSLRVVDISAGSKRPRLRIREDDLAEFIESRTFEAPPDDSLAVAAEAAS